MSIGIGVVQLTLGPLAMSYLFYFGGGFDTSWTIQQWVWLTILPYLDGLLNLMNTWSKNRGCHCPPPLLVKIKVHIFLRHILHYEAAVY